MLPSSPLAATFNSNGTFRDVYESTALSSYSSLSPYCTSSPSALGRTPASSRSSLSPSPSRPLSRHLFSLLQPSFQWHGCCSRVACGRGSKGARQRQAHASPSCPLSLPPSLKVHFPRIMEDDGLKRRGALNTRFMVLYVARDAKLPILFERTQLTVPGTQLRSRPSLPRLPCSPTQNRGRLHLNLPWELPTPLPVPAIPEPGICLPAPASSWLPPAGLADRPHPGALRAWSGMHVMELQLGRRGRP